jgi:DinB superfamily
MPTTALDQLLALIDEAFDHRAWHGPTLRGSLRGVTLEQALWRPAAGRHDIWEIVLHAAYWKYAVRRRIDGGQRGSFPIKGSNWFRVDEPTATVKDWRDAIRLLEREHRALANAVGGLMPRDLHRQVGSRDTLGFLVRGIAAHDLYHAGQIQLLKRLGRGPLTSTSRSRRAA